MENQNIAFMLRRKKLPSAKTEAERIAILQELTQLNPKDRRDLELRTKYKKELETLLRKSSSSSKGQVSNNPYDRLRYERQVVLVGEANSGKSTLLRKLTGAEVQISDVPYSTYKPEVGMFVYNDISIQIIELPATYSGDNDKHKYLFLRNSDVICITARNQEEARSVQNSLEDQLVITSDKIQNPRTHKYRSKSEIIEKPSLIASWSAFQWNDMNVVDMNSIGEIGAEIYRLLHIQRIYCFRNGKVEGNPLTFPLGNDITVKDFADKLGMNRVTGAKIYDPDNSLEGQLVGLSYVLKDGNGVWLK